MDWDFDGVEFDEEEKLREETRKILELPALPVSATCVRVPVLVGHAEAIWIETQEPLSPEQATAILGRRAGDPARAVPDARAAPRVATTSSSAGSAATRRARTASPSSSSATTCARARR